MPVPTLTYRLKKGSALTPGEMDGNLAALADFADGLETRADVATNSDGTLKDASVDADVVAANAVTTAKILDQNVTADKLLNTVAGDGLLKAANANPISVNVDDTTIAFDTSTPKKIKVKDASIGAAQLAATVRFDTGHAILLHEASSGTDGGSILTANTWLTRPLTTIKRNINTIVLGLSANQITLAAGTYRFFISSTSYGTANVQARLRNVTSGVTLGVGSSATVSSTGAPSIISGYFTLTDDVQKLEVQVSASSTQSSDGFGHAVNRGEVEVYCIAEFWKEV